MVRHNLLFYWIFFLGVLNPYTYFLLLILLTYFYYFFSYIYFLIWPRLYVIRNFKNVHVNRNQIKWLDWWNWITISAFVKALGRVKDRLRRTRYFTYIFVSLWKMSVFFCSMLLVLHLRGQSVPNLFAMFYDSFGERKISINEVSHLWGHPVILCWIYQLLLW